MVYKHKYTCAYCSRKNIPFINHFEALCVYCWAYMHKIKDRSGNKINLGGL